MTQRTVAQQQRAEAQQAGAREAFARGKLLEARSRLRLALEIRDSRLARSLWWRLKKHPLVWKKQLGTLVNRVAFSPDGNTVAAAGLDRTVYLFDTRTGGARILRGNVGQVMAVAFSPDGRFLASGSWDGEVRIWEIESDRNWLLRGHTGCVWDVSFSPGGALLASGSYDKTVRLWDVKTRKGRVLGRHADRINGAHFHPDGRHVGTSSADGTARIWDLRTGRHTELRGRRAEVNWIRFSPDGQLVATASDDGTIRLWETDTGRPVWRAPLIRPQALELFTHGGWIRLGGQRKPGGQPLPTRWRTAVEGTARVAAESPDGKLLCLGTHGGTLEIWDIPQDRRLAAIKVPDLDGVAVLPNACVTLAKGVARRHDRAGASRTLRKQVTAIAWDTEAKELLVAAARKVWIVGPLGKARGRFPADTGATAVARVGDWIAVGYRDGNIELVPTRARQKKPTFAFEGVPSSPVVQIIPGPRGTLIAGYANGVIGLWSLRNGARFEHARLHGSVIHLLIKGTRLYAASDLGQHMSWDLSMFHIPYCDLLRQVWKRVPVVWEAGQPALRPPPRKHRCAK